MTKSHKLALEKKQKLQNGPEKNQARKHATVSTLKLLNKQLTIAFDRDKFRAINSVTTTAKRAAKIKMIVVFHLLQNPLECFLAM